jgi:hypothetical protein
MANTFTLISSSTVPADGSSSIVFSNIPGTYNDLCLKFSLRGSTTSIVGYNWLGMRFNSSSGETYTGRLIFASGTSVNSYSFSDTQFRQFGFDNNSAGSPYGTANTFSNGEIYISNYTNTSYSKTISVDSVAETNASSYNAIGLFGGLWPSSAAITSISLYDLDVSFVQNSTASLYGIRKS